MIAVVVGVVSGLASLQISLSMAQGCLLVGVLAICISGMVYARLSSVMTLASRADAKAQTEGLFFTALTTPSPPMSCASSMHQALQERANREIDEAMSQVIHPFSMPWLVCGVAVFGVLAWMVSASVPSVTPAQVAVTVASEAHTEVSVDRQLGEEPLSHTNDRHGGGTAREANTHRGQAPPLSVVGSGSTSAGSADHTGQLEANHASGGDSDVGGTQFEDDAQALGDGEQGGMLGGQVGEVNEPSRLEGEELEANTSMTPGIMEPQRQTPHGQPVGKRGNANEVMAIQDIEALENHESEYSPAGQTMSADDVDGPMILTMDEQGSWQGGVALPGSGGINDAGGSSNSRTERTESLTLELEQTQVSARWRRSAAGVVQGIEGGQTGRRISERASTIELPVTGVIEGDLVKETIPVDMRGWVHDYFVAIGTVSEETQ